MSRKRFSRDLTQEHAMVVLDELFLQLVELNKFNSRSLMYRLVNNRKIKKSELKGCYLWGGVGRGKTFIMDLFYEALPIKNKKRIHFHHFMKDIHERLNEIKETKNPLNVITKQLSKEFSVLCLDEFMVHDIGDAMVLSELLSGMNEYGITLLTTSNMAPENLYLDGLQREQFLKTIAHLNKHCHILHVDSGLDYRTIEKIENTVFYTPESEENFNYLQLWLKRHQYDLEGAGEIEISSRKINYRYISKEAIWFDFASICKTNRSRGDYIQLIEKFKVIVISGLHVMDDQANDITRRFISFVDVLYDNRIKLLISSSVEIDGLYEGDFLKFEFKRTMSRLYEMQAKHYLSDNSSM